MADLRGGSTVSGNKIWHEGNFNPTSKLDTSANAVSASKLATARTITLGGDLSGSATFDGSANITITGAVADNSHLHTSRKMIDDRDVKPVDVMKGYEQSFFTSREGLTGTAGTDYQDLFVLNGFSDVSGGNVNALAFDKSTLQILHYQAAQTATTWGTPKTLAYIDSDSTGNAATATKLQTARTISLGGNVTGSASFDGSGNVTITTLVTDNSHSHTIGNVTGLQAALDGKSGTSHTHSLNNITDVTITTPATGQRLEYDGTKWINSALSVTEIPSLDVSKITTGTFNIARIPTGTTSTTVALGNHSHTFSSITSKPTTIDGYGITDGLKTTGGTVTGAITMGSTFNLNSSNGRLVLPVGPNKYA